MKRVTRLSTLSYYLAGLTELHSSVCWQYAINNLWYHLRYSTLYIPHKWSLLDSTNGFSVLNAFLKLLLNLTSHVSVTGIASAEHIFRCGRVEVWVEYSALNFPVSSTHQWLDFDSISWASTSCALYFRAHFDRGTCPVMKKATFMYMPVVKVTKSCSFHLSVHRTVFELTVSVCLPVCGYMLQGIYYLQKRGSSIGTFSYARQRRLFLWG